MIPIKVYSSYKHTLIQKINKSYVAELDRIQQQQTQNFVRYFPMLKEHANQPKIVRSLINVHQLVSKPEISSETKLKVLDELKYLLLIPDVPDEVVDVCQVYLKDYALISMETADYEI